MPNDGTGTNWDEANPGDSNFIGQGAREILDLRIGVRRRIEKEHTAFATAVGGGVHKKGSNRAFFQTTDPTLAPGGSALGVDDDGRSLYRNDMRMYKQWRGAAWETVRGADSWALLSDRKSNNVDGGDFTSGAWRDRGNWGVAAAGSSGNLDDLIQITGGANDKIQLVAGIWRMRFWAPAFRVDRHKARLWDVTNAAVVANGSSAFSGSAGDYGTTHSIIVIELEIATDTEFTLQHQCQTTRATDGFGIASNFGDTEVYSMAEIVYVGED